MSADGQHVTPFALSETQALRGAQPIIEALVAGQPLPALAGAALAVSSVKLESPLPVPRRNVWCVGRNYHAHAKELQASVFKDSNTDTKAWPIVFTKVPECVVGPTDDVQLPGAAVSEQIDYEAELAVIIGQGGKNISQADAMKHVFGYTVVNDISVPHASVYRPSMRFKCRDGFCPMGPAIVARKGVARPDFGPRPRLAGRNSIANAILHAENCCRETASNGCLIPARLSLKLASLRPMACMRAMCMGRA